MSKDTAPITNIKLQTLKSKETIKKNSNHQSGDY